LGEAKRLRSLLGRPGTVVAPGAYDALTAKIVESTGFEAVYMTGFGVEASVLGKPDLGYISLTESAIHAGNMAKAVTIPLVADADVGFGGALNAARTVEQFEAHGVAGIHIEDQFSPKRSAYVDGVSVLPRDEFVGKIRAAVRARQDPDFLIIARTDAYESMGYTEVVDRANACVDVGADMVFITGEIHMPDHERDQLSELVKAPRFGTIVSPSSVPAGARGKALASTVAQAAAYKLVVLPIETLLVATKAVMDYLAAFKRTGDVTRMSDRILSFDAFDEFIGLRSTILQAAKEYEASKSFQ
jgi:2-methylisocitrate lyase-like PEP mutase family enzyme